LTDIPFHFSPPLSRSSGTAATPVSYSIVFCPERHRSPVLPLPQSPLASSIHPCFLDIRHAQSDERAGRKLSPLPPFMRIYRVPCAPLTPQSRHYSLLSGFPNRITPPSTPFSGFLNPCTALPFVPQSTPFSFLLYLSSPFYPCAQCLSSGYSPYHSVDSPVTSSSSQADPLAVPKGVPALPPKVSGRFLSPPLRLSYDSFFPPFYPFTCSSCRSDNRSFFSGQDGVSFNPDILLNSFLSYPFHPTISLHLYGNPFSFSALRGYASPLFRGKSSHFCISSLGRFPQSSPRLFFFLTPSPDHVGNFQF